MREFVQRADGGEGAVLTAVPFGGQPVPHAFCCPPDSSNGGVLTPAKFRAPVHGECIKTKKQRPEETNESD